VISEAYSIFQSKESRLKIKILFTVREILIKEQQQRSVHTKLDSFFNPALLRSKTGTTSVFYR
jgi:hypothetical protein